MKKAKNDLGKALVFEAGSATWAVELNRIKEIVKAENVEPLPNSSPRIAGIISVRGEIIPVLSPQWCDGTGEKTRDGLSGDVLLLQSQEEIFGIGIDHVHGIEDIHAYDLGSLSAAKAPDTRLISCSALVSKAGSVPLLDVKLMVDYLKSGNQMGLKFPDDKDKPADNGRIQGQ